MVGKDLIMATLFGSGGGSSGSGGVKMTTGTLSVAEEIDITSPNFYQVKHGLGELPKLIVFQDASKMPIGGTSSPLAVMVMRKYQEGEGYVHINVGYNNAGSSYRTEDSRGYPTDDAFFVGRFGVTTTTTLLSGHTYVWYAFCWEDEQT